MTVNKDCGFCKLGLPASLVIGAFLVFAAANAVNAYRVSSCEKAIDRNGSDLRDIQKSLGELQYMKKVLDRIEEKTSRQVSMMDTPSCP